MQQMFHRCCTGENKFAATATVAAKGMTSENRMGPTYDSFFFASSGTFTLVEPTSVISVVVVVSMSRSPLGVLTVACMWNAALERTPSLSQTLTVPLALLIWGGS